MKSDDIQRAVRANRHERSEGDAPSLGRLARMPGTGLPKGIRRRRKRNPHGRQSDGKAIRYWSILLGGGALACLGVAVFFWLRSMMDPDVIAEAKGPRTSEQVVRVASKFPSPPEKDALNLVRQALAIREPDRVLAVFHPGTATPREIVDYLGNIEATDGVLDHYEWLSSMDANDLAIDGVLVHFKNGGKIRQRVAFLTPDANGVWKIDFDAFARTVSPSWNELLEKGADHAIVRVFLGPDSYYNGPFSDDTRWICYGMASPDADQSLVGYCRTGSPQATAIKWMFSKGSPINRATLEIRRVAGGSPKQFEIARVLAEDWVMGPKPFDEGFK